MVNEDGDMVEVDIMTDYVPETSASVMETLLGFSSAINATQPTNEVYEEGMAFGAYYIYSKDVQAASDSFSVAVYGRQSSNSAS